MAGSITLRNARLVLPDRVVQGDVVVVDGVIEQIGPGLGRTAGEEVDAAGLTVLPGLVDTLVDVPLGHGDDGTPLARLSGEAVASGITTMLVHDPWSPAVDRAGLQAQLDHAQRHCRSHFGVYMGADPAQLDEVAAAERTPGVRICLGRCGVDHPLDDASLDALFERVTRRVVAQGQDPEGITARERLYADAVDPAEHSRICVPELAATALERVVAAARRHGRRVHLARVSSAAELAVLAGLDAPLVTAQATVPHLFLKAGAVYKRLGTRAVIDPPVRDADDVDAVWKALGAGALAAIASGHVVAPVAAKDRPYPHTAPGMPTVASMLPLLLDRVGRGELSLTSLARLTSEQPARLFGLPRVGRLEVGFDADLVLVDTAADVTLRTHDGSWSGWSPFDGFSLRGRPVMTLLRGRPVYRDGRLVDGVRGRELTPSRS
ncbi:MAG: amidohydrolase family protein [Alphaproteobacteria bacterium]|nr:amidohydrolase family protein [Alphaproteobacteria bacterium]